MSKYLIAIKNIARKLTVTAKHICGPDYNIDMNTIIRKQDLQPLQAADYEELFAFLSGSAPGSEIVSSEGGEGRQLND